MRMTSTEMLLGALTLVGVKALLSTVIRQGKTRFALRPARRHRAAAGERERAKKAAV